MTGRQRRPGTQAAAHRSPHCWRCWASCMATSAPARCTPSRPACRSSTGLPIADTEILGVLSLLFWSLILIVTVKYVTLVMRADNRGEGGILALMALAQRVSVKRANAHHRRADRHRRRLPVLRRRADHPSHLRAVGGGRAGGLRAAAARIRAADQRDDHRAVVHGAVPRHQQGRQRVRTGHLAVVPRPRRARRAVRSCSIPTCCWRCRRATRWQLCIIYKGLAFFVLGAVVLVVTGAEALYADMGHFGARPIRVTWIFFVLPSLVLNYFGQGALMHQPPRPRCSNPFFLLAPARGCGCRWCCWPPPPRSSPARR